MLAIVDVLDSYRTLAEMTRACFGRLGQLLDSDEAREAVKVVDWRVMDHALWALKAYPDDMDLLLVRKATLVFRFDSTHSVPTGALENRGRLMFPTPRSRAPGPTLSGSALRVRGSAMYVVSSVPWEW